MPESTTVFGTGTMLAQLTECCSLRVDAPTVEGALRERIRCVWLMIFRKMDKIKACVNTFCPGLYKWLIVFFPHGLTQTRPFASWTLRSLRLKAKSQLTCHHVCFKQSERYNYAIAIIGFSRDKQIWCLREVVTETRVNMRFLRSNSKIPCRKLVEIYKIYRSLLYQINKGKKKLDHGAITQNNIRENYDAFSIRVLKTIYMTGHKTL